MEINLMEISWPVIKINRIKHEINTERYRGEGEKIQMFMQVHLQTRCTYHVIRKTTIFVFKSNYTIFIRFIIVVFAKYIIQILLLIELLLGWRCSFIEFGRNIDKESLFIFVFCTLYLFPVIEWNIIGCNVIVIIVAWA